MTASGVTTPGFELIPFRLFIDRIVEVLRPHFLRLFLPMAVPMALSGLWMSFLQVRWVEAFLETASAPDEVLASMSVILAGGLALLAVYGLMFAALTVAATDVVAGRPVDLWRAWRLILRPGGFLTVAGAAAASILSFMMCFLPALYVVPALSLVLPLMAEEGLTGRAAFRRSAELIQWNPGGRLSESPWVQVLVLLFIGWVVSNMVSLAVQLPFLVVQQILIFRQAAGGGVSEPEALLSTPLWLQIPTNVLASLATAASWLYLAFGLALLFREVRRRREAPDLEEAVGRITAAPLASSGME